MDDTAKRAMKREHEGSSEGAKKEVVGKQMDENDLRRTSKAAMA